MALAQHVMPEVEYPCVVIGVDPGGTTGCSALLLTETDYTLSGAWQFADQDRAWLDVQDKVTHYKAAGYQVWLAVEQFDKRPGIINPDYSAKYVERDIDNNVQGYDYLHKQIPAEAKNLIKEAKNNNGRGDALKRFGLYQTGLKHSNDSLRHGLTFAVVKLKHSPTILKGWPKK